MICAAVVAAYLWKYRNPLYVRLKKKICCSRHNEIKPVDNSPGSQKMTARLSELLEENDRLKSELETERVSSASARASIVDGNQLLAFVSSPSFIPEGTRPDSYGRSQWISGTTSPPQPQPQPLPTVSGLPKIRRAVGGHGAVSDPGMAAGGSSANGTGGRPSLSGAAEVVGVLQQSDSVNDPVVPFNVARSSEQPFGPSRSTKSTSSQQRVGPLPSVQPGRSLNSPFGSLSKHGTNVPHPPARLPALVDSDTLDSSVEYGRSGAPSRLSQPQFSTPQSPSQAADSEA